MSRFAGKVAFVTGAARGQGRSHAVTMAEEGADVIICDLCAPIQSVEYLLPTAEDLEQTAEMIRATGQRAVARQVDVRDGAALAALVSDAFAELGRLDIVLANAGISTFAPVADMTDEVWQPTLDINLGGVLHSVRAALPAMLAAGHGGSIVLTSSAAGTLGLPNMTHYVAAKHGVVGLMRALANELGAQDIRVNAVLPGTVNTDMADNPTVMKLFRPDLENPTIDDADEVMRGLNLLPIRWVEAVDITNAVLFLCSDEARYITGVALPVDAGYVIKAF
jgi:(+)-trans-carveol dehydrogenase